MERLQREDTWGTFQVDVERVPSAKGSVLFAVGRGGDPQRHAPLLQTLSARGWTVIAPHALRFARTGPSEEELKTRASRLRQCAIEFAPEDQPILGVGHSIGAMLLLALSGAQAWMGPERPLDLGGLSNLHRLALFAPASGYFQAPGALDHAGAQTRVWVGSKDRITPFRQTRRVLFSCADVREVEGAGHFSFMDVLPPHIEPELSERAAFLTQLADEVGEFLATP